MTARSQDDSRFSIENKNRALDLMWRRYEQIHGDRRRLTERTSVVLVSMVGGLGLVLNLSDNSFALNSLPGYLVVVCLIAVGVAFYFGRLIWMPSQTFGPKVESLHGVWTSFVDVPDDTSCANLISDLTESISLEKAELAKTCGHFNWMLTSAVAALILGVLTELSQNLSVESQQAPAKEISVGPSCELPLPTPTGDRIDTRNFSR